MQNTQPTAQPTCVETHTPSRGSSTLSTVWPSASASSRRGEPSAPRCSETHGDERGEALPSSAGSARRSAQRQLRVLALRERVERQPAHPGAQHQRLVPRPRARGAQRVTQARTSGRSATQPRSAPRRLNQLDAVAFGVDDEGDEERASLLGVRRYTCRPLARVEDAVDRRLGIDSRYRPPPRL